MNSDIYYIGLWTLIGFIAGHWQATSKQARRVRVAMLWRQYKNARRHNKREGKP